MKKINTLILIFSLVIPGGCFNYDSELNIPCRGNNCITFDITTSTGLNSEDLIKNAQVEIGWQSIGGIFLSVTDRLATGKTDENGNFHFSVSSDSSRLKKSGSYYVKVFAGEQFYMQSQDVNIVSLDTTVYTRIHVPSKARVIIKYKNFHPVLASDYFGVTPYFSAYGSPGIPVDQIVEDDSHQRNFFFNENDTPFDEFSMTAETAGDQYTYFQISTRYNDTRIDRLDSIYIKKGSTGTFEVSFN